MPILKHGDFTAYETSAIVGYLEESFPKPALQPKSVRDRAGMTLSRTWNSVRREGCGLTVAERELAHAKEYLLGSELSLADFDLLPSTYSFSFAPEAKAISQVPGLLPLTREDGSLAHGQEAAYRAAAACAD